MDHLKKFITLAEASRISGYHPDYLSALIRKGELPGQKVGRTWCTTEAAIRRYLYRQKFRSRNFAVNEFLSPTKVVHIVAIASVIFVGIFSLGLYLLGQFGNASRTAAFRVERTLSTDMESVAEAHERTP